MHRIKLISLSNLEIQYLVLRLSYFIKYFEISTFYFSDKNMENMNMHHLDALMTIKMYIKKANLKYRQRED
jgi:hypothetical protein